MSLIFFINNTLALPNPAAIYCKELGYDYKIVKTSEGESGFCIFPDKECKEWEFYAGECGQEYSYCAKNDYGIKTKNDGKNPYSPYYSVCVDKLSKQEIGSANNLMYFEESFAKYTISEKVSSVAENVNIESTTCSMNEIWAKNWCSITCLPHNYNFLYCVCDPGFNTCNPNKYYCSNNPDNGNWPAYYCLPGFDWRDATYNGIRGNWTTSVKNQGNCGSCWAFATIGMLEAKFDIIKNNPNFDKDLSEQDLVSCGVPKGFYPDTDNGGCNGAKPSDALNYIMNTGVIGEYCFPYSATDESCSNKCSTPSEIYKISGYGPVPQNNNDIKIHLLSKGPLVTQIYMDGYFDNNGIYRCDSPPPEEQNHAILTVGFNDSGVYWIAKNSWGKYWPPISSGFNDNGFFKVGYGECNIEVKYFVDTPIIQTTTIKPQPTTSIRRPLRGNPCSRWACPLGTLEGLNNPFVIVTAILIILIIVAAIFGSLKMISKNRR
jgi:hypothetical protein